MLLIPKKYVKNIIDLQIFQPGKACFEKDNFKKKLFFLFMIIILNGFLSLSKLMITFKSKGKSIFTFATKNRL